MASSKNIEESKQHHYRIQQTQNQDYIETRRGGYLNIDSAGKAYFKQSKQSQQSSNELRTVRALIKRDDESPSPLTTVRNSQIVVPSSQIELIQKQAALPQNILSHKFQMASAPYLMTSHHDQSPPYFPPTISKVQRQEFHLTCLAEDGNLTLESGVHNETISDQRPAMTTHGHMHHILTSQQKGCSNNQFFINTTDERMEQEEEEDKIFEEIAQETLRQRVVQVAKIEMIKQKRDKQSMQCLDDLIKKEEMSSGIHSNKQSSSKEQTTRDSMKKTFLLQEESKNSHTQLSSQNAIHIYRKEVKSKESNSNDAIGMRMRKQNSDLIKTIIIKPESSSSTIKPQKNVVNQKQESPSQAQYFSQHALSQVHKSRDTTTYESERSSIFAENLQQTSSFPLINQQMNLYEVTLKRSVVNNNPEVLFQHQADDQQSIPSGGIAFLAGSNNNLSLIENLNAAVKLKNANSQENQQSHIKSVKIHQHLEYNQRMKKLTELNERLFLKNQFLRVVDVRNNQIKELPHSICELNILWKLRVDYNLLSELPNNIDKLERLEVLTASNNQLARLPSSLFSLSERLSMLQVNDNLIKKLPQSIGQLKKLKVLLIHNNLLRTVPSELRQLKNITEFSLEWFNYLQPPVSKVLKDERGVVIIKDFLKLCSLMHETQTINQLNDRKRRKKGFKVSFIHFLAYFNKCASLVMLNKLHIFPKNRNVVHYLCLNGHLHLLKEYFKSQQPNEQINSINFADADGTTPLTLAFKNKQTTLLIYLMQKFNAPQKNSCLTGNLISRPFIDLTLCSKKYGLPFHLAIKNYDFQIIKTILRLSQKKSEIKFNVNSVDQDGNNALHITMAYFNNDSNESAYIAIKLIKMGIDINALNKQQLTPFHVAIKTFQNKSIKFALDYNIYHILKYIKQCKKRNVRERETSSFDMNLLVSQMFDLNLACGPNNSKWNALHYAVFNNNLIAVSLLLQFAYRLTKISQNLDKPLSSEIQGLTNYIIARDAEFRLPQELCPYNSPISKIILSCQQILLLNNDLSQSNKALKPETILIQDMRNTNQKSAKPICSITFHHRLLNFRNKTKWPQEKNKINLKRSSLGKSEYIGTSSDQSSINNTLRRVNSNNIMQERHFRSKFHEHIKSGAFEVVDFTVQSESESENRTAALKGQEIQNNTIKKAQTITDRSASLVTSRTEKNLFQVHQQSAMLNQLRNNFLKHGTNSDFQQNMQQTSRANVNQTVNNFNLSAMSFENSQICKQSPRLFQKMPPLPPKELIIPTNYPDSNICKQQRVCSDFVVNDDMDQLMDMEELIKSIDLQKEKVRANDSIEEARFMSHAMNFETEQNMPTVSLTIEEALVIGTTSSDSCDEFEEEAKSVIDNDKSIGMQYQSQRPKSYSDVQSINALQYQSAPKVISKNQVQANLMLHEASVDQTLKIETTNANLRKVIKQGNLQEGDPEEVCTAKNFKHTNEEIKNEGDTSSEEDEDEEEDGLCDAEDEEPEAGAMGQMIGNRINKFENNSNIADGAASDNQNLSDKQSLLKVIEELREIKRQKKLAREVLSINQGFLQDNSNYRSRDTKKQENLYLFSNRQTPKVMLNYGEQNNEEEDDREEGNVFDTLNHDNITANAVPWSLEPQQPQQQVFLESSQSSSQCKKAYFLKQKILPPEDNGKMIMTNNYSSRKEEIKKKVQECLLGWSEGKQSESYQLLFKFICCSFQYSSRHQVYNFKNYDDLFFTELIKAYRKTDMNSSQSAPTQIILIADLIYLFSMSGSKTLIPQYERLIHGGGISQQKDMSCQQTSHFVRYELKEGLNQLMQQTLIQSQQLMEQCNIKLNLEREKSRERLILQKRKRMSGLSVNHHDKGELSDESINEEGSKNAASNIGLQLSMPGRKSLARGTNSSNSFSIREVPEFVARLNKSPSMQSLTRTASLSTFTKPNTIQGAKSKAQPTHKEQLIQGNHTSDKNSDIISPAFGNHYKHNNFSNAISSQLKIPSNNSGQQYQLNANNSGATSLIKSSITPMIETSKTLSTFRRGINPVTPQMMDSSQHNRMGTFQQPGPFIPNHNQERLTANFGGAQESDSSVHSQNISSRQNHQKRENRSPHFVNTLAFQYTQRSPVIHNDVAKHQFQQMRSRSRSPREQNDSEPHFGKNQLHTVSQVVLQAKCRNNQGVNLNIQSSNVSSQSSLHNYTKPSTTKEAFPITPTLQIKNIKPANNDRSLNCAQQLAHYSILMNASERKVQHNSAQNTNHPSASKPALTIIQKRPQNRVGTSPAVKYQPILNQSQSVLGPSMASSLLFHPTSPKFSKLNITVINNILIQLPGAQKKQSPRNNNHNHTAASKEQVKTLHSHR